MAGSKSSLSGDDFYEPYAAQDTAKAHASELGMQTVPSLNITYTEVPTVLDRRSMTCHSALVSTCFGVQLVICKLHVRRCRPEAAGVLQQVLLVCIFVLRS